MNDSLLTMEKARDKVSEIFSTLTLKYPYKIVIYQLKGMTIKNRNPTGSAIDIATISPTVSAISLKAESVRAIYK